MAGYHIYLRKTSGSTLLGIMSLTRNSVGVYNDFTANVDFMNTVHGYVWTKSIVYGNHLYDNGLLVGDTLHVPYIFTGYEYNANEDPSVYGYMYFENY